MKKQGTPTMGGLVILTSIIVTSLFYLRDYPKIIPVLFVTVGFGIIGFLDDYIKIVMKRSEGLNPKQKLLGQFVITGIFCWYLITSEEVGTSMLIPFTGGFDRGYFLDLGWLFIPFCFCDPGHGQRREFHRRPGWPVHQRHHPGGHLHDGGGCGGEHGDQPYHRGCGGEPAGLSAVQRVPRQSFMGDTGSLALGGFVASSAFMMQIPLFIAVVGLIYLVEVLSVIIQVTYFKKPVASAFSRWRPSTITSSCAAGRRPGLWPSFPWSPPFSA